MLSWGKKNSDHSNFDAAFMEHIDALYSFAYQLTRDRETAEDLVQDTALRAYRFYDKFEKGTNLKAWLMKILRNLFYNDYRKKSRQPLSVELDKVEHFVSAPEVSNAQEEHFGELVQHAMSSLTEELRGVVTLFYIERLSYKEIAEVMDCPVGTVMSRLHTAKQALKQSISKILVKEGLV